MKATRLKMLHVLQLHFTWHSHKGKVLEETKVQWLPGGTGEGASTTGQVQTCWNYGKHMDPDCDDRTWTLCVCQNEHYHEPKEVNFTR